MNALAERIAAEIETGLSRRQIAYKVGVSEATIRNALMDEPLSRDVLKRFAKYYRLPVSEVYRMVGILEPPSPIDLTYQEEDIIKTLASLRATPYYQFVLRAFREVLDIALYKMDAPDDEEAA